MDIVAEGFDAGVRLGEALAQDMIAVRFGGDVRFLAVASQAYLSSRKIPRVPEDLKNHTCIRNRLPGGKLYRWEFEKRGREVAVDVPGAPARTRRPQSLRGRPERGAALTADIRTASMRQRD
jgi:DNA-binding transcriptional LysR family regulator